MQKHIKAYFDYFGYDSSSFISCEICGAKAVDIHHIKPRSMFGSKIKAEQDHINNLMALCRCCHDGAHNGEYDRSVLSEIHMKKIEK